ncbi:hypothetical protein V5F40_21450 [Xanthobacter sp. DSM 14520]|uniref:hypothetical protein n=1 Tax=Xanthobacter autotrophicus (strain ATCC BAA-1158 / Py2) TaxID=78245 RepID=UPI003728ACE9
MPVAFDEWERLSKAPGFADLLLSFPAEAADLIERRRKPERPCRFNVPLCEAPDLYVRREGLCLGRNDDSRR